MKHIYLFCLILVLSIFQIKEVQAQHCEHFIKCEICEALVPDSLIVSDPVALFDSLPQPEVNPEILNLSFIPKVFSGYEEIQGVPQFSKRKLKYQLDVTTPDPDMEGVIEEVLVEEDMWLSDSLTYVTEEIEIDQNGMGRKYKTPDWLKNAITTARNQESLRYSYMIDNPLSIEYAYWDLPIPPVLLEEDRSFLAFIKKYGIPDVNPEDAVLPEIEIKKKHWLHKVNAMLQFSQAYVSPNWYQGGNSYLSLLFGFSWNVDLNQVYHPNLLFQSALSYKLALSANPKGYLHKYTIGEDLLQYNLNAGLKAIKNWYYSFNLQFKTQLLNNYEENSDVRTASFLSPGDLNMGLGMSYNHTNKLNTFKFTLTISPLSYNLKTCISNKIDHEIYSIPQNRKVKNEIGSNVDFTMDWKISANISYKTRMFMFTDYEYFLGDWQNTISFEINKFLSTQLFFNLRYDGSLESDTKWKKFMLREILSFGLSYTFSTKPN